MAKEVRDDSEDINDHDDYYYIIRDDDVKEYYDADYDVIIKTDNNSAKLARIFVIMM